MKNIKSIYRLCIATLLLIVAHNTNAQQTGQNITGTYIGTWQYDNNNERFIVKIWQEGNDYYGHFKKVQLNNGVVGNIIFNSIINNISGFVYPFSCISAGSSNEYGLTGFIYDNIASGTIYKPRRGNLQMKMTTMVLPNGCTGCVVKASWKVTPTGGLIVGTPPPFSIPLDIELTKVSNTITLD